MHFPSSTPGMPASWMAQQEPRTVRADVAAAVLLVVGGAAGIVQFAVAWRSVAGRAAVTGWDLFRLMRAVPNPTIPQTADRIALLVVAVAGGALVLLGLSMLAPISHWPLGIAAMLVSVVSIAGSAWVLARASHLFDDGWPSLFGHAHAGWYLFLISGLIGLFGSIKAVASA